MAVKQFRLALWFHNIVVVNGVANLWSVAEFLRAWGTFSYMVSKYFTVRLICKTKFPDTCHALKNNSAVKGLKYIYGVEFLYVVPQE